MNFFGGGQQQQQQGPDPVVAAKTEMEMYTVRTKCDIQTSLACFCYALTLSHIVMFLSFSGSFQQNCRFMFQQVRLSPAP